MHTLEANSECSTQDIKKSRHVIVTRPFFKSETAAGTISSDTQTNNAVSLIKAIEQKGDIAHAIPFFYILPPSDPNYLKRLSNDFYNLDYLVFVSPTAVEMVKDFLKAYAKHQIINNKKYPVFAAVGAGSAFALSRHVSRQILFPENGAGASALLNRSEFNQKLSETHIGIICGEEGASTLAETLKKRGANVFQYTVYQRTPMITIETLQGKLQKLSSDHTLNAIVLTTSSAMQKWLDLVKESPQWRTLPVVAAHPKLATLAKAYKLPFVIESGPQNTEIIESLYGFFNRAITK